MKIRILGFVLLLVACAIVYGFAVFVPFSKNINLLAFLKGFAIGVGAVACVALIVRLTRNARQNAKAA